jgi:integrase
MPPCRRKTRLDLPPRMYEKHGAYYYVTRANQWIRLSKDLSEARIKWTELENGCGAAVTMATVIEKYLKEIAIQKAPSTLAGNKLEAEMLRAVFGHMPPSDITPGDIHGFMIERGKTSQVRANRERSLLHAMMRYAVLWGHIDRNPVGDVPRFVETPRVRYVSDEDFLVVRSIAPVLVQCMMDLALMTAQRSQDLLSIRKDQITEAGIVFTPAKTARRKPVKISVEWSDPLRQVVATLKGLKRPFASVYLITSADGSNLSESGWKTAWQRTMNKAIAEQKITERFHFHDLRAKAVTDMELAGRDAQTITGHSSRQMIERVYRRLSTTHVKALESPSS